MKALLSLAVICLSCALLGCESTQSSTAPSSLGAVGECGADCEKACCPADKDAGCCGTCQSSKTNMGTLGDKPSCSPSECSSTKSECSGAKGTSFGAVSEKSSCQPSECSSTKSECSGAKGTSFGAVSEKSSCQPSECSGDKSKAVCPVTGKPSVSTDEFMPFQADRASLGAMSEKPSCSTKASRAKSCTSSK